MEAGVGELVLGAPSIEAGALPALLVFTLLPEAFRPARGTGDAGAGAIAGAAEAAGEADAAAAGAAAAVLLPIVLFAVVLLAVVVGAAAAAVGDCVLKAELRVSVSATPWFPE